MSRPSPDLARLRHRVMLAVGLPPLVLSVAVGCATGDKADFDAVDSERAAHLSHLRGKHPSPRGAGPR